MKKQTQQGFTLIELVIVIVILGILAAAAVPRFINLAKDARTATVEALAATMRSAAYMVHAQVIARGIDLDSSITLDGTDPSIIVNLVHGYPSIGEPGIQRVIELELNDTSKFQYLSGGIYQYRTAPTPAECRVTYAAPTARGLPPTITVITTGC